MRNNFTTQPLKCALTTTLLVVCGFVGLAQSRLYISAGMSDVYGTNLTLGTNGYYAKVKFRYQSADFEYETRFIGNFSIVSGLSWFNAGYKTDGGALGSASYYHANYLAVPLMFRWNVANKNFLLVDLGLQPSYLASAHLRENIFKFGNIYEVEGNITHYTTRFYLGSKFQVMALVNRFHFGLYVFTIFPGQSSLNGLQDHWGLNSRQSNYLLSNGFANIWIFGLKSGVRIR
jgi:hypothetical protein